MLNSDSKRIFFLGLTAAALLVLWVVNHTQSNNRHDVSQPSSSVSTEVPVENAQILMLNDTNSFGSPTPKEQVFNETTDVNSAPQLYDQLLRTEDLVAKRYLREQISDLTPSDSLLTFLLERLKDTRDEDQRTQLYSIITLMSASGIEPRVKELALMTRDEELFLSLVWSLKHANSVEARVVMFELMAKSYLTTSMDDESVSNAPLIALHRNLLDTLTEEDMEWLQTFARAGSLSSEQLLLMEDFSNKVAPRD